jgi:5-(aminomethyl)-3-furanmethanol phosphate kinase
VEAVIKVGGSLAEAPSALKALGAELSRLAKNHRIVVVPGGGKFADAVRELDAKFTLPAAISHRMAILAMDQYGLLLSPIIPDASACEALSGVRRLAGSGQVPILLPSRPLSKSDPFEPSWDVTSDSIAAYVAVKLRAAMAIFVTDVDGVFTEDPKNSADAKLLNRVTLDELLGIGNRTSVDKYLPRFLKQHPLKSYVVNGNCPERIGKILCGRATVCTRILHTDASEIV